MKASDSSLRGVRSQIQDMIVRLLALVIASAAFAVKGFDGDGQTQIIWQNDATREAAVWLMSQTNLVTAGLITNQISAGWRIAAVADFDRDGHPELLWRPPPSETGSTGFEVAGTGDFDGDGYPDILWRDPEWNLTGVWFMNGSSWSGRVGWIANKPNFSWNLVGTGDFNHDGYADIVWRDRYTGRNTIWLMNGLDVLESVEIQAQPDLGYRLAGTGAFNLLGKTDLLWRHANGQNIVWLMNGTQYVASVSLPSEVNNNWRIAGVGGHTNSMLLSAIPNEQSQSLTLLWRYGSVQLPSIERRIFGTTNWDLLATNYLSVRFTNSDLTVGQRYEYRVGGEYLLTGIAAAPIEDRGKIILVVDRSLTNKIEPELELLRADLAGDGWSVIRTNVPRHDEAVWANNIPVIASIKSFITNTYYADPARTKAVYLIGHVPIPYSGFSNPDGHGARALPADVYYGDVDGIYTDSTVNFNSFLDTITLARHANLIGDGRFDQNRIPANADGIAELELAVGRADFWILPAFGATTETELTQRYIRKTHRYRHKQFELPQRVSVGTYFASGPSRDSYAQALKMGSRLFGMKPENVVEEDPFNPDNSALWGILGGSGLPSGIVGFDGLYHTSGDMALPDWEPRVAFANVFASYVLDFHYPNNFMRAFLGTPHYGLAIMWFRPAAPNRIPVAFEPLGLGENLGTGFVRAINESQRELSANTYIALLGDPTLRLQVLAPPGSVTAISERFPPNVFPAFGAPSSLKVSLEWTPSLEADAQYFVYRSTNGLDGPWVRLTQIPIAAATSFTDASALSGPKMYEVRAVKLVKTGSGSYTNLSQGVFVEVP